MKLNRRCLLCAGAALASGVPAWASARTEGFEPARLVGADGAPLKASTVGTQEGLVFAYPYRGVPCFLINLGDRKGSARELKSPSGADYSSPAGVGPGDALVAYVAICTHQWSHPTPSVSALRYAGAGSDLAGPGKIVCCAHGSVFDPASGGDNVAGPAQHPLLPVMLAWNEQDDTLSAVGSVDPDFFQDFFKTFKADLIERYGPGKYREPVGETTQAVPLSAYSKSLARC